MPCVKGRYDAGAEPEPGSGGSAYEAVDGEYVALRGLRRQARVWSHWELGLGVLISGDFFSRNFGLAKAGFVLRVSRILEIEIRSWNATPSRARAASRLRAAACSCET